MFAAQDVAAGETLRCAYIVIDDDDAWEVNQLNDTSSPSDVNDYLVVMGCAALQPRRAGKCEMGGRRNRQRFLRFMNRDITAGEELFDYEEYWTTRAED